MFSSKDPRKLWHRYVVAILLLLTFTTASHLASLFASSSGEELSRAINVSGRQRMLSQRILFFSAERIANPTDEIIGDNLQNAIDLFERSHTALIQGGSMGLSGTLTDELRNLYFEGSLSAAPLDTEVSRFIAAARAVYNTPSSPESAAAFERMKATGPGPLLRDLNEAVTGFENQARLAVEGIRDIANLTYGLAILVLALVGVAIFIPAQRTVVKSLDKFEEALSLLRTSEKEARMAEEKAENARHLAEEASAAKAMFVANMSHEIRTPLNAVIGFSGLALNTDLTSQQHDYLSKIKSSSSVLLNLVNDILDMSKIDADQVVLEETLFDLDELLANISTIVSARAAEKSLELLVKVGPNVPMDLIGDPLRIGQVFTNLAGNAVKFTNSGEVILTVNAELEGDDGVVLYCEVIDSGIGMSADVMAKLFKPFTQADASMTRKYGGTGLGLTISKQFVELMGGEIKVVSEENIGTTFSFDLHMKRAREGVGRKLIPPKNMRGANILVADDNDMARQILQETLETLTFNVTACKSGVELIDTFISAKVDNSRQYDLIVLDWKMPEMDGIEVARQLIANFGKDCPPIILLTGFGIETHRQKAMDAGIKGFLTKPTNQSLLFDKIVEVIGTNEIASPSVETEPTPAAPQPMRIRAGQKGRESEARMAIRGAHVLIAEDNDLNQQVVAGILSEVGVTFEIVPTGLQAVKAMTTKWDQYDGILMDLQMPEMDGFEATKRIRAMGEKGSLPIMAMTAHAMAGDKAKCLAVGMNDHIAKPLDPDIMFATMAKWVKPTQMVGDEGDVSTGHEKPTAPPIKQSIIERPKEKGDLPEHIAGLDLEQGLRTMMGNRDGYKMLLEGLVEQFYKADDELSALIVAEKTEDAIRHAHSLKGIAGNLGARELYTIAAATETSLKEEGLSADISAFQQAVRALMDPLKDFFEGSKTDEAVTTETAIAPPPDLESLTRDLSQMRAYLTEGNMAAEDMVANVKRQLRGELAQLASGLEHAVTDLEFEKAAEIVTVIAAKLEISIN